MSREGEYNMPVTSKNLTAYYSSLTDFHLSQVNPAQLRPLARPLWASEVERRKQARLAARHRPTPRAKPARSCVYLTVVQFAPQDVF